MAQAEFGPYKMPLLSGYRISLGLRPGRGINGAFYVYVCEQIQAPDKPNSFVSFAKAEGRNPKGNLVIGGDKLNYTFRDIHLIGAIVAANRNERFRIFEFNYPRESTDLDKAPVSLSNSSTRVLNAGAMGAELRYSIKGDGSAEYLLGESTRIGPNDRTVLRFEALRNQHNSFVKKIIEVNDAAPRGGTIPNFTIDCGRPQVEVTHDNLDGAYVMESFGVCLNWDRPTLSQYLLPDDEAEWLVRTRLDSARSDELLEKAAHGSSKAQNGAPDIVETATFCFKQGYYVEPELA